MKSSIFASAAVAAGLIFAGSVQAAELVDGVYYGGGNAYLPGNWTVNTVNNIELGLRGHVYQDSAPAPAGNVYIIPLNSVASLDWSFDNLGTASLAGLTSSLTISNAAGGVASYDALSGLDNAQGSNGGEQNSLRLNFGFLNGGLFNVGNINYNAGVNSTYNVTFSVSGQNFGTVTNSIVIQQGSGFAVPEPTTWALMMLGFGGVGAVLRRRRNAVAFA